MSESVLPLTGERTTPGIETENYWFRRHEAAYAYLSGQLTGTDLLEVGAGEGYGAARLAAGFDRTVALDYDRATIAHLGRRYPQLHPIRANLAALPLTAGAFDAVVALQVIEHVWFPGQFLQECRRVLRPGGQLVVSTPNRLTFSPGLGRGEKPRNPFHIREFDIDELTDELARAGFRVRSRLGLRAGPRLAGWDERFDGGLVAAQLAEAPDGWPEALRQAVAAITVEDFELSPADLRTSLDLVVLADRGGQ